MSVFWKDDKLRQIAKPLIDQIPVCIEKKVPSAKDLLSSCFISLVDSADDDDLLKSINNDILMHTRSKDGRIRLFAASCSVGIWQNHAQKLVGTYFGAFQKIDSQDLLTELGFASVTAPFIQQCGEDFNDEVVREAIKLKKAVEAEAGVIEGL